MSRDILYATQSLCPVCLRRLDAYYINDTDGAVLLARTCPEHGEFATCIWPSPLEAPDITPFQKWKVTKTPSYPQDPATDLNHGCPYDCGLCPAHAQHTCHGLLEVTMRCNLACPVCYASAGEGDLPKDPSRAAISAMLANLLARSGTCNVQISGGEPTVREDLPDIIREAKALGFPLVQVNSNGVRLGQDKDYARKLAEAGLDSVYLQWDSLKEDVLAYFRGTRVPNLREIKEAALANCAAAGLGVVLVATLVKGVNDQELGDLLRDAVGRGPVVRGLHLQPASYFGRSPVDVVHSPRLTLGHVMQALASQAPEWIRASDFHPPCCEHSLCSFSAVYARVGKDLVLEESVTALHGAESIRAEEGSRVAKAFIARQWSRPGLGSSCCGESRETKQSASLCCGGGQDAFSKFLDKRSADRRFTLSCMAFQDALSLDIERLRGCCIHIVRPDGRMVPFCAQNMTSLTGIPLYPDRLQEQS